MLNFTKNYSVLQCIKKNGSSLEHLELARSSLLRMDPLRFRNVLSSATRLHSLVVRNIASDAMLKLIGAHCTGLQVLVVANSKQVCKILLESQYVMFQVSLAPLTTLPNFAVSTVSIVAAAAGYRYRGGVSVLPGHHPGQAGLRCGGGGRDGGPAWHAADGHQVWTAGMQ